MIAYKLTDHDEAACQKVAAQPKEAVDAFCAHRKHLAQCYLRSRRWDATTTSYIYFPEPEPTQNNQWQVAMVRMKSLAFTYTFMSLFLCALVLIAYINQSLCISVSPLLMLNISKIIFSSIKIVHMLYRH